MNAVPEKSTTSPRQGHEDDDIQKELDAKEGAQDKTSEGKSIREGSPCGKWNEMDNLPVTAIQEPVERVSPRLSTSQRIATGLSSTTHSAPEPPPDGGFRAWCMSIMTFFVLFNSWGFVQSFGVFQTYYVDALHETASSISWIGSVQVFLLFILGLPAGRATDAGFFRPVFVAGLLIQLLAVFLTSLSTNYWQVFLTQGVCQGIGSGMQFVPAMSVLSTYFDRNRALAVGIAATGTTIAGIIMPVMVQQLLPTIGFAWTVRSLGLMMAVLGAFPAIMLKTRIPSRKAGPLVDWSAFVERPFLLFCIGMFLGFWGVYFPFYYVGSYASDILGETYSTSISLLLLMNGVGIPGRLLPNIIADRFLGPLNTIALSSLAGGIIIFSWAAVHTSTGLWVFAAFFGFFGAGIQSLFPACLAALTPDLQKRGVRMGMGFGVAGLACLTGTPLGGKLVQANNGYYLYAQMWAGASLIAGALFLIASRIAADGVTSKTNANLDEADA